VSSRELMGDVKFTSGESQQDLETNRVGHEPRVLNPQPNPQILMSYATSANFGSPRGSVKSLKSLISLRCHGSVLFRRLRLTVGQKYAFSFPQSNANSCAKSVPIVGSPAQESMLGFRNAKRDCRRSAPIRRPGRVICVVGRAETATCF
jgi:hypothetical protein